MERVEELLKYIKETYDVEPTRPWVKHPETMTFQANETKKCFAFLMPVEKKKLGLIGDETIFVINVKAEPEWISMIVQADGYLPAYHMNKEHWLTVCLDGTVKMEQIKERLDESYRLVTDSPSKRIYEAVKQIPRGKVATYGKVAELAGDRKMARAVGNALHKNPDPEHIPCYRVVNAKGELAGAFAFGGAGAQEALLRADGIEVNDGMVDLKKYGM